MTLLDAAAKPQPQNTKSQRTIEYVLDDSQDLHMTVKDLRCMLRFHGDFVRELTLFEVARDGLARARQRSKVLLRLRRFQLARGRALRQGRG